MMKARKWWKQLRGKERVVACALAAIAALWLGIGISAVARADGAPGKQPVRTIKQVSVLKTSVTALAANMNRHGWCVAATGASVANTVPVWFTLSTSSGVTRAATAANGQLIGPGTIASVCDDGSGGFVYTGAVTVIALSTSSGPVVTTTEW